MKSKLKRKGFSKIVVLTLIFTMIATSACSGFLIPGVGKSPVVSKADTGITKSDNVDKSANLDRLNEDLVTKRESIKDDEKVYYIIEAGEDSLYTMFENRKDKNISYQDFVSTRSSRVNSENISNKHKAIFNQISKKVDVKFTLSLTGFANAFAVSVNYGDRKKLEQAALNSGALSVTISERYDTPQFEEINNSVPAHETGIFERPEKYPYQGENMVVAVLDTSLDYEHEAFRDDAKHLPSVYEMQNGERIDISVDENQLKFNKNYIATKLPELVANGSYNVNFDDKLEPDMYSSRLSVNDVYVNRKVPFAYDYADYDTEVNATQENAHGTHVSGIIVGRSENPVVRDKYGRPIDVNGNVVPEGSPLTQPKYDKENRMLTGIEGVAPRAQIVAMKVFSDFIGGAEDVFLYGALEDCARLGVDVVNLSLGRGSGFTDMLDNPIQQYVYEFVDGLGINLIVAAGNGYSSGMGGHWGANLTTNPDSATVGSPSSMYEGFSVASINGIKSKYIKAMELNGTEKAAAYITESNEAGITKHDFISELRAAVLGDNNEKTNYSQKVAYKDSNGNDVYYLNSETGEMNIPFELVPGYGRGGDYGATNVRGKIALVSRGINSFVEKLKSARDKGALGIVVYNNAGGIISMSVDENEVKLPSCTIKMDESIVLRDMKRGIFQIDEELSAGPFMSSFSSWGPLPSLELKPDITGHGGEIYSAYPGNNYNRISGTSMAAPNISGLMLLTRQHIKLNKAKYGIADDGSKEDNLKIQTLTYRLMMSTATMPLNEDGNPYSPRKTGAGLANIGGMLNTNAYIVTKDIRTGKEQNRSKLELFDDPDRDGVYEMEFVIRNLSNKELKYNLKSFAFTEDVASDMKIVAEKAYMFEGNTDEKTAEWKVDGAKVTDGIATARPNGDTTVSFKFTLTENDKKHLEQTKEIFVFDELGEYVRDDKGNYVKKTVSVFENGMFVEGFIRLDGIADGINKVENLGVPFLAYYGDWNDAPMFEPSTYVTDRDDKDRSKNDDAKVYPQARAMQAFGRFTQDGYDYTIPMGKFLFEVPEDSNGDPIYNIPYATPDRTTLSLSRTSMYQLYFVAGFLRGAKYADWTIRNKHTGELMDGGTNRNCRKDSGGNLGGLQLEIDVEDLGCKNGVTYTLWFEAELDHFNGKGAGKKESWEFDFTIDTDAPIITDTELRIEKDVTNGTYKYFLDFYIHDDNYAQAMSFSIFDSTTNNYVSVWDKGLRPINGVKNGTTRVIYDITAGWEHLSKPENNYRISTDIYDYAWNMSHYEINLKDSLHKGAEDLLELGDIGIYREYTKYGKTYKVLESERNRVIYNPDGSYNVMDEIYLVKNQSVNLGNAIITKDNVWPDDLEWYSYKREIVRVDKETGEIFAVASEKDKDIMTEIMVTSKSTGKKATINVWVISDDNVADFGISTVKPTVTNLSSIEFVTEGKYLRAGETFEVEIKPNPWFANTEGLTVDWDVRNKLVATVKRNPGDPFKATVTASQSLIDGDEYLSNFDATTIVTATIYHPNTPAQAKVAQLGIYVMKEFITNGSQLTAYNGTRENLVIPKSLGVTTIAERCFINDSRLKTVTLPEGVERIERAAFAYCSNLMEVYLPSTIKMIGEYAFTGSYTPRDGLNSSLQVVDTTKFIDPVQIEGRAFINNPTLGTNSTIKRTAFSITPSHPAFRLRDSKIDTYNFRVVGERAFAGASYLTRLDLENCRSVGPNAFSSVGSGANSATINVNAPRTPTTIILGPRTGTALNSLAQTGAETLEIPMPRIDESAFNSSRFLRSVTFTGNNVHIGDSAFSGCSELVSVDFEGSVSYIGKNAFADNRKLTNLRFNLDPLQGGAKYIDDYAFLGAPLSARLTLPVNLEYLGTDAFSGTLNASGVTNSNVTTLVIPAGFTTDIENFGALYNTKFSTIEVTQPGVYFVENNILLKNKQVTVGGVTTDEVVMVMVPLLGNGFATDAEGYFKVPDSVTMIGENAFGFNQNLEKVDLNLVKSVDAGAMQNMKNLTSVKLSANMKKIPDYMFRGCTSLTTVENTNHIEEVGKYAFAGYVDPIYVVKDGSSYKVAASTDAGAFEIIERTIVPITSISLPSCKKIGEGAFSATAITSFDIPTQVTEIPDFAFYHTLSLTDVTFHNKVESIGECAFYMTSLRTVEENAFIPGQLDGVKYVGSSAFAFDEFQEFVRTTGSNGNIVNLTPSLTTVNLPKVEIIGGGAFSAYYGGGKLSSVSLPKVEAIGAYAFEYQTGVNKISASPSSDLTTVGNYAFAGTGMSAINMPNVTYIGAGAFYDCLSMKGTLEIPKNVEYIGPMAFAYTEVTEFKKDANIYYKVIDGVLFRLFKSNPNALELAHYPTGNGRRDINGGIDASSGSSNLSSGIYVVPEGTTRIGQSAFTTVKTVSTVVLPKTLTHIGDKAFFGSLVKVYEFTSFNAPVLESGWDSHDVGDLQEYNWAVYANFYNYFSPTSSYYTWTNAEILDEKGDPRELASFRYQFRYNTITNKSSSDSWVYGEYIYSSSIATPVIEPVPDTDTQNAQYGANSSITGGGDLTNRFKYGLILIRPSNGRGYSDFIYKYYFDSVVLTTAIKTSEVDNVISLIDALPAASQITLANISASRTAVTNARNYYNFLSSDLQELVENYSKLLSCETAVNQILASIKSYSVAFQVDGVLLGKVQIIESGGQVVMPTAPAAQPGYAFDGWYINGVEKFENTGVTQDMILVARWVASNHFRVTFAGINVDIESQMVASGAIATMPQNPVREGYEFKGWFTAAGQYNFSSPVSEDITLYAEWTKKGGCGCGSIALGGGGTGLLVALISFVSLLALSVSVLLKKRTISKRAEKTV